MSNTHEYVVFDRAKVDPALSLRWPAFEKAYLGWDTRYEFESARDLLVDWGIDNDELSEQIDDVLARKTVRSTLAMFDEPFSFFLMLIDIKRLTAFSVDIAKYDDVSEDEIVSCAAAGYDRGDLSLASLTAVCDLHLSQVDMSAVLPRNVEKAVMSRLRQPMLPGFPDELRIGADGIGVAQSRRVIAFLLRAWRDRWPLQNDAKGGKRRRTLRSCEVAKELVRKLQRVKLKKPCMIRWFEC